LVDAAWNASDAYARRCYLGQAPGTASDEPNSGLPDWIEGKRPDEAQLAQARVNFAVLLVTVKEIDWYHLAHDRHRRALFTRAGARWLTP
jgi:hypothetical protein